MTDSRSDRELALAIEDATDRGEATDLGELTREAVDRFVDEHAHRPVTNLDDLPDDADAHEHVAVTFHPQAWRHDYAVEADAEGPQRFYVPTEDATDDGGELYPDDSSLSDGLARHENAPTWIRDWSGPFYVTISR